MNTDTNSEAPIEEKLHDIRFFPKGAIAFFSLMLSFFVIVWLFIYGLMIYRAT